jgi:hypothetical protein
MLNLLDKEFKPAVLNMFKARVVEHPCNLSYSRGRGKSITWGQSGQHSETLCLKKLNMFKGFRPNKNKQIM